MQTITQEQVTDWNNGHRITLKSGKETLRCTQLDQSQLYGIIFYNTSETSHDTTATVTYSNDVSSIPVDVIIPKTQPEIGKATVAFVHGADAAFISVSITSKAYKEDSIDVWLCSIDKPKYDPNLRDANLPADGEPHDFTKYHRYFADLASTFYDLTIITEATSFMTVEFRGSKAKVIGVNGYSKEELERYCVKIGKKAKEEGNVTIEVTSSATYTERMKGEGMPIVYMSADSLVDAKDSKIKLHQLSD